MYWKIEPYNNNDHDYCVMYAKIEENHREALRYAQERLEDQWDQLKPGELAKVTIKLCKGDLPKGDYNE